jgi:hypothetical protein
MLSLLIIQPVAMNNIQDSIVIEWALVLVHECSLSARVEVFLIGSLFSLVVFSVLSVVPFHKKLSLAPVNITALIILYAE